MDRLKIRLLNYNDIHLIEIWINKEHVKKWYGDPNLY